MYIRFRAVFMLSVLLCLALLLTSGCKRPAQRPRLIGALASNTVIAVVNGSNVYAGMLEEVIRRTMAEYEETVGAAMTEEDISRQRRQLIEQLITETVVRQKIAQADVAVSDEEFEQEYVHIVTNQFGTWDQYMEELSENDITTAQFARAVFDQIKLVKVMRAEMGIQKATDEDARSYYEGHSNEFDFPAEVALSHILIKAGADDSASEQSNNVARLQDVRKGILAGMPFSEAAKKFSECPSSSRGGYIGTVQEDDRRISELIARPAFTLPLSNVSDIVESEHGYHLLYVTKRTAAYTASYDQIQTELIEALNQDRNRRALQEWLLKVRKDAVIEDKL